MSHPDFHNGALPLSASAINPNDKAFTPEGFKVTVTPREMTVEDIKTTVKDFQNAINAVKAGFDGVEIPLMVICFSSSLTERLIIERNTVEVLKTKPVYSLKF
jgi:hypothetical protein